MSKNLLRDVITKQTGSLTKAIKELVQNSRDAKATRIDITIQKDHCIVKDNGKGMSPEDIVKYFKVFGETAKRDNEENDGRFGMGRGQIMSFGKCSWRTQNSLILVDIKEFLGYNLKELKKTEAGCTVKCEFSNVISWWGVQRTEDDLKEELLPNNKLRIYINEKQHDPDIELLEAYSNDTFDIFKTDKSSNKIYCRGLQVKEFSSNFDYNINVKRKAELNFARNEFLETDSLTDELQAKINEIEELMTVTKNNFDNREARQTLNFLNDGRVSLETVMDKYIVRSATDKKYTLSSLMGKEIMFGDTDIWSDDCMRRGLIVVHRDNYSLIRSIIRKFNLDISISGKTPQQVAKKGYHRDFDEDKLTRNKVYGLVLKDLNSYVFKTLGEDYQRDVFLGESDIANAWTDGETYIYVNKNNVEYSKNKEEICLKLWHSLCHEYSHDEDNKSEDYHSREFFEKYHDLVKRTLQKFSEYIRIVSPKRLKELYID